MRQLAVLGWFALVAGSLGAAAHDAPQEADPPTKVVRFIDLEGEYEPDRLREELAALRCESVRGPWTAGSQKGHAIFAIASPPDLAERELLKALKRAKGKPQLLQWIAFDGPGGDEGRLPSFGADLAGRDHVLGLSGHIRWYAKAQGRVNFYVVPKKIRAKEIRKVYDRLFDPYGGGGLEALHLETIERQLTAPVPGKLAKKLRKSIGKLDGVTHVELDAESGRLRVEARAEGQTLSMPPGDKGNFAPRFATHALDALLDRDGLLRPASASK